MRDVAERFGVGLVTAFRQHDRVTDFLISIAPNVISFPHDYQNTSDSFEQVKFLFIIILKYWFMPNRI